MPSDADKLSTVKQYMRRKYSGNVAKLKRDADDLFDLATEEVTITSSGFEGGNTSGQVSFPKILLLQAIEELILELDPTNTPKAVTGPVHPDFSNRQIST